jgi:asparagine synthase (glutamine-hydrolysing)
MCGIVGFASKSNYRLDLNEVNKTYLHRGPDSQDFVYFKNCGLAMNRLSIIGIGEEGNQPMTDSSNRYTIVYNGEIFNSREIRSNLISLGYDFKTLNSDTEVVLASYIVYGDKCCSIFNGMFSFVIYDNINQTLFGAIDRFGIKPLNFIYKGDYFVFASEVKTLKSLNILTGKYNSESIINYFKLQYIPFEQTIYDGISKLLPGSFFSFDILENNLKFSKYFKPEFSNSRHVLDLNQFSYEFSSAVKRWSHSEVDLGLSLSGGLDSSLIASYCVKNSINFKAFTVFFKDKKYFNYNEINEAKRFANYLKIDLIEVPVDEEMVKNSFTDMLKALDEPYCGGVPSYFIYKKMKDVGLKVALTGVGGDELFGNYGKWDKYFKVNYVLRKYLKSMVNFDFNQISNFYGTVYSKYNSNSDIKSLFLNFRESDLESRISN